MSITVGRAPSSGPHRSPPRVYSSTELAKKQKSDLNRDRNALIARYEELIRKHVF
jgi:hypothetical protein